MLVPTCNRSNISWPVGRFGTMPRQNQLCVCICLHLQLFFCPNASCHDSQAESERRRLEDVVKAKRLLL